MKAFGCFVLVFGLCVSSGVAFGFPFKSNKDNETVAPAAGNDVAKQPARESKPSIFGNEDIFSMGKEFMKKAQMKMLQLEESVLDTFKRRGQLDANVQEMQNRTSKDIKKPDLLNVNEDTIPSEVNNNIDDSETVSRDLSGDTLINNRIWEQQKASGLVSLHPDIEIINVDDNIPQSKYYYTPNHIDEPLPKDLSKDTLINDRISQQQASAGIISADPDSEQIDVKEHEQVPSQTHTFQRYQVDPDTEIVESPNGIDQVPAADLSRDTVVNQRAAQQVASGLLNTDPDSEFIDGNENKNYYAPNTIQQVPLADLSRDTVINDRIAEQQAASGLVMIDPDAELIDDKKIAKPSNRNYYRVDNSPQQSARAINRNYYRVDNSPQQSAGAINRNYYHVDNSPQQSAGAINRNYYHIDNSPQQSAWATNKNYYPVEPQDRSHRDLSSDLRVNDIISRKEKESGLVMIDPDAELIDTNAYQQYPTYYYVPNHIEQVERRKRVPSPYQVYERRIVQPQSQPQVLFYPW